MLVFYPLAFSRVCTKQLTQINQHGDRYAESDAQVLGFSGRATFVIDKNGIVQGASLPDASREMPDEEEYFQTLAACPI